MTGDSLTAALNMVIEVMIMVITMTEVFNEFQRPKGSILVGVGAPLGFEELAGVEVQKLSI